MSTPVWPIWLASTIPAAIWLEPRLPHLMVVDLVVVFLYHWSVIVFSLLLRERTEAQIQVQQLEQELAEKKKKNESRKSR